ncbi:MAG: GNAT family N-acetyltransferase [Thermoplasmata archaeon]
MSRKKFRIRHLRPKEIPLVPELWTKAGLPFRPKGRDSLDRLAKQRRAAPDLFLGAFIDDKLVGVAIASDDGRKGWINRLAVLPDARRMGLGKALIRECERALRKRGHKLFSALIEDYNRPSMKFFESAGYKREENIIYYTKRLTESY